MTQKRKPGPKPEIFKVPLPFEDAVKVALGTPPPRPEKRPQPPDGDQQKKQN